MLKFRLDRCIRIRFFGSIRDWIYDLRSHEFFVAKETKNPKTEFSGVTAHFQPVCMNEICITLKFCETFTIFVKFRVHAKNLTKPAVYLLTILNANLGWPIQL